VAGRVIAVVSGHRMRGPLAVVVDNLAPLQPIVAGDPVSVAGGVLRVGRGAIQLDHAPPWDPALPVLARPHRWYASGMREVIGMLRRHAPVDSLAPLLDSAGGGAVSRCDQLLVACEASLRLFGDALRGTCGVDRVAEATAGVAGLGPGLTPSGDDLLTGILHAVTVWPDLARRADWTAARRVMIDTARPRTTRISTAYLEAAARGLATEPWHALVRALAAQPPVVESLRAAVLDLLRFGETSGADGLTGFCWTWRHSDVRRDHPDRTGRKPD
jgi:hypothetical protein